MGRTNTKRVEHDNSVQPSIYRNDELSQILDDISEDMSGKGYTEIVRTGVIVSSIILWNSAAKNFKKTETLITRTGIFIDSIVHNIYKEDGSGIAAYTTYTLVRQSNKQVIEVSTVNTRNVP